jgi:hypothetical protein
VTPPPFLPLSPRPLLARCFSLNLLIVVISGIVKNAIAAFNAYVVYTHHPEYDDEQHLQRPPTYGCYSYLRYKVSRWPRSW